MPRSAGNLVLQGHAIEELHRDEVLAGFLADVINRADAGMIQRGGGARLAAKALQRLRIAGDVVRQKLQRNKAAEASVLGFVRHTHPATTKLLNNAVVRDRRIDHVVWTKAR